MTNTLLVFSICSSVLDYYQKIQEMDEAKTIYFFFYSTMRFQLSTYLSTNNNAVQSVVTGIYICSYGNFYTYSLHRAHFGSWKNLHYVKRALVETDGWQN